MTSSEPLPPPKKPTVVFIIGILSTIWGGFGIFGVFMQIALFILTDFFKQMNVAMPPGGLIQPVQIVMSAISSILLLAAGIGLIRICLWARLVFFAYFFSAIATVAVNLSIHIATQQQAGTFHQNGLPLMLAILPIVATIGGLALPLAATIFLALPFARDTMELYQNQLQQNR